MTASQGFSFVPLVTLAGPRVPTGPRKPGRCEDSDPSTPGAVSRLCPDFKCRRRGDGSPLPPSPCEIAPNAGLTHPAAPQQNHRRLTASRNEHTLDLLPTKPPGPPKPSKWSLLSPGSDAKLVEFPSLLPASRGRCLGGHPESAHFSRARPPQCSRRVPAGTAGRPPMTLFPPRAGRVLHPAGRAQVTAPWFYTCPSQNLRTRLWK